MKKRDSYRRLFSMTGAKNYAQNIGPQRKKIDEEKFYVRVITITR